MVHSRDRKRVMARSATLVRALRASGEAVATDDGAILTCWKARPYSSGVNIGKTMVLRSAGSTDVNRSAILAHLGCARSQRRAPISPALSLCLRR